MFRIPIPKTGGEVLNEGIQNLMERLMRQKQIENEAQYRNATLQLAAQKEAREAQLNPIYQQLYQAQVQKALQDIQKSKQEQELANTLFGIGNENTNNNQQLDISNLSPSDKEKFNAMQPGESFKVQNNNEKNVNNIDDQQKLLQSGKEVVIRPPDNDKRSLMDKFPGATVMGFKIPDIKSNVVDGIRYDKYPSGKIVAQKVGPNTEEKAKIGLDVAEQKEQAKANIKRSSDLKDTGKMLNEYTQHVEALENLLKKNKQSTGLIPGYKTKFKMGSGDAAIFQSHATPMVGKLSKDIASRGGAVVSGLAQAGKPDVFQPYDYNVKMIEEQAKSTYNSYKNAQREFQELHPNKPLPSSLQLPKFFDKVRVKAPNGLTYVKTQKEAENLVKKYPGSQILGNIYE